MSITFQVSNVEAACGPLTPLSVFKSFDARLRGPVEACGANAPSLVNVPPAHGFIATLQLAFDGHLPLVLSPDDVWLCIAQGFAHHVNQNAEALRGRFVRHDGKQKLKVRRDDFVKGSPENPWPEVFREFSDQIAGCIGKKRDLVVADFSTTGPVERAASEIVLMDAVQSYFEYELHTLCGIPRITLTGIPDDWRSVRTRAQNLAEYDIDWWIGSLLPVLDAVVRTASGDPDPEFWESFYSANNGSGGPYVTGWCNVLFPYIKGYRGDIVRNGATQQWREGLEAVMGGGPTSDRFTSGLSMAPLRWMYLGKELPMELLGGFAGVAQEEDGSLRPAIGWAVRDRPAAE